MSRPPQIYRPGDSDDDSDDDVVFTPVSSDPPTPRPPPPQNTSAPNQNYGSSMNGNAANQWVPAPPASGADIPLPPPPPSSQSQQAYINAHVHPPPPAPQPPAPPASHASAHKRSFNEVNSNAHLASSHQFSSHNTSHANAYDQHVPPPPAPNGAGANAYDEYGSVKRQRVDHFDDSGSMSTSSERTYGNWNGYPVEMITEASKDQEAVRDHYSNLKVQNMSERDRSQTLQLRKFNNWVKNSLITQAINELETLHPNSQISRDEPENDKILSNSGDPLASVLDLCGGKFGDLQKWRACCDRGQLGYVVLADHSKEEVQEGVDRYNEAVMDYTEWKECKKRGLPWPTASTKDSHHKRSPVNKPPNADFVVADCFRFRLFDMLPNEAPFDLISCQFSLHYAFETQERAEALFENVSQCLKAGGLFIGTIPDANVIVKRLRRRSDVIRDPKKRQIGFRNNYFSLFMIDRMDANFPKTQSPFGIRYRFMLKDAVNDCDEFLVIPDVLRRIASKFHLSCVRMQNFHDFYNEVETSSNPRFSQLRSAFQKKLFGGKYPKPFNKELWEVINVYQIFMFKKAPNILGQEHRKSRITPDFRERSYDDIREVSWA